MTAPLIEIWTDGSGTVGGNPTGCGIVLLLEDWMLDVSYYPGMGTNNTAELMAILLGLRFLKPKKPIIAPLEKAPSIQIPTSWWQDKKKTPITLYTDSEYAMHSVTGKYDGSKNKELIERCRAEACNWAALKFQHVRGHSDVPNNERADYLAGEARQYGIDKGGACHAHHFTRFDVFFKEKLCMSLMMPVDPQKRWELKVAPPKEN